MKKILILFAIGLFVITACKKDDFGNDDLEHNYTTKSFPWDYDSVEYYHPGDTIYIVENFQSFNSDLEDYREDSEHAVDDYHVFDAFWLLFSNLNYEYGNVADTFCPDTSETFTFSVSITSVENDTPWVNGQSMASEIIDAEEDIASILPDNGVVYVIFLSVDDIQNDYMDLVATVHYATSLNDCRYVSIPTTTPKPFVSGDRHKSVNWGTCGGGSSSYPMWKECTFRLNPHHYYDNTTLQNVMALNPHFIIISSNYYYYSYSSNPNDFWHGTNPNECMTYTTMNYYLNAAADLYDNLTIPDPNKHIYWARYDRVYLTTPYNYWIHNLYLQSCYFYKLADPD